MVDSKGQVSFEFMIFVAFAILTAIFLIKLSYEYIEDYRDEKNDVLIKDIAYTLQTEVYIAAVSEEGYTRYLDIPEKLDGYLDYNITLADNQSLVIYTRTNTFLVKIPIVNGSFTKRTNFIQKKNGAISLS